ncbi:hypothetical protein RKE29_02985 [Streptomyces sp. B1866]|uniref:hypothetical protein n=1 Tax=Streptomyces sp. B1866 TaxID=3075431 RepID=UPI00288F23FB|nr:hypothetical protein [Streptomyces sp. B1866]MDT3395623.1 hypothetical protein [Streptomyces sp. B1866]
MSAEAIVAAIAVLVSIAIASAQGTWSWRRRRLPDHDSPLRYGDIDEGRSFSVQDLVKVVNLQGSPGRDPQSPGSALLTDAYLIQRESEEGNGLVAIYSTRGQLSACSTSHPYESGEYDSTHMAINRAVAVPLSGLPQGVTCRVVNRVSFEGAYDGETEDFFETHIERPTRSLTIILVFAQEYRCTEVFGLIQTGGRSRVEPARDKPMVLDDGRVVYWHVTPVKTDWLPIHARYRVRWKWRGGDTGS